MQAVELPMHEESQLQAATLWMAPRERDAESRSEADELAGLIERAATGDASAFEQILFRTERRVLRLAARILGNMDDAQDATQEVFLRAFKYLHRFDRKRPFEPWLLQMTVNVCLDMRRKRQLHTNRYPDLPDVAGDPHLELASREEGQLLRAALAGLPEKERAAVILRDLEGLATAEVAEILGSSQSTVRVQLSNARLKIRKFLKKLRRDR